MADVMENMDTPKGPTQQPGRISTIFQCYREKFLAVLAYHDAAYRFRFPV